MKARHIKKLRKVIANFKEYEVSYSSGLFGDFGVKEGECCKKIMARNPQEAIKRYLKWYFRKYKCRNRHHTDNLAETSRWWGKFMVVDSKGYSRYFM
jgi:hypothetical protein